MEGEVVMDIYSMGDGIDLGIFVVGEGWIDDSG